MSREKIKEIARDLCECYNDDGTCCYDDKPCDLKCENFTDAQYIYAKGYRKQSEGEWIEHIEKPSWLEDDVEVYYNCSVCGTSHWSITPPFCPNCGAKMKGGAK